MKLNRLLAIASCSSLALVSSAMVWIGDKGVSGQTAKPSEKPPLPIESSDLQTELLPENKEAERFVNGNSRHVRFSERSLSAQPSATALKPTDSGESAARSPEAVPNQAPQIPPRWVIVDASAKANALAISTNASTVAAPHSPAPIPLAFQNPPPAAAENPQIKAGLEELQQNFVDAIGGPNQDPADPEYLKRWITAQRELDVRYRLLVGTQQFLIEQMEVNNQAE